MNSMLFSTSSHQLLGVWIRDSLDSEKKDMVFQWTGEWCCGEPGYCSLLSGVRGEHFAWESPSFCILLSYYCCCLFSYLDAISRKLFLFLPMVFVFCASQSGERGAVHGFLVGLLNWGIALLNHDTADDSSGQIWTT